MAASSSCVSVIIPTHNRAAMLATTVESVLTQTYPAVEIVIVDDGSSDETPTLVQRWGERVVYLRQENRGVEAARQRGLGHAGGAYVNFLDDDDVMAPDKLARQVALLEADRRLGVVHCGYRYVDAAGRHLETTGRLPEGTVLPQLVWGCFPWSGGPLLRRECLATIGHDEHRDWYGDWGMWLRTALAGWAWGCVQEPLGAYRMLPGSMIDTKVANCERLVFHILDQVFTRWSLPPALLAEQDRIRAGWSTWLAWRYYLGGSPGDGARCLRAALTWDPALAASPEPLLTLLRQDALTPRVRVHDPLALLAAVFAGLPPEAEFLRPHRAQLEARVLVGLAVRSWGADDGAGARRQLEAAVARDPGVLGSPEAFCTELVAWARQVQAWTPAAFVDRVLRDLPPSAASLAAIRKRALSELGLAEALRRPAGSRRRWQTARGLLAALRYRPSLLWTAPGKRVARLLGRLTSPPGASDVAP